MAANGDRPLVLGTVGTDHHPYDRFVTWMAAWAAVNPGARVVVQSGTSKEVDGVECRALVPVHELDLLIAESRVVVTHAGPSTILQARRSGRLPIVLPRRPELGEHVDGHQVRFATWMAGRGMVALASSEAELHAALDQAMHDPAFARIPPDRSNREEVSAVFGDLVDTLVSNQRRRR